MTLTETSPSISLPPATAWPQPAPGTGPDAARLFEPAAQDEARVSPTFCGLTPTELHDRFWAARGVQVLRPGVHSELVQEAELFLLLGPDDLVAFRLRPLLEDFLWVKPELLWVRLGHPTQREYRECVVTDADDCFVRFERTYEREQLHFDRAALTRNLDIAQCWREAESALAGWKALRQFVPRAYRSSTVVPARVFDRTLPADVVDFLHLLVRHWRKPSSTIDRLRLVRPGVWADADAGVPDTAELIAPLWIGAGRSIAPNATLAGTAILWDYPQFRPPAPRVDWRNLVPGGMLNHRLVRAPHSRLYGPAKRLFDICFSLVALAIVGPLLPLIMLAIYLEDGRPFFFAHQRQGRGGRHFPCLKFRSMRKDADRIKAQLRAQNAADGPQFFMENDPRVTRIGYRLRKYNLDELPQFINVLLGHMSIVGPRPSPHNENQYCPAWREARLSVRPGITGLWQVKRSRIAGQDFQEWIKYDIEYVETESLWLDLRIIAQTVLTVLKIR